MINRYLITVDTDLVGSSKEYFAEDVKDIENDIDFLNICNECAYDNYQDYSSHFEYEDEQSGLDPESDEYFEMESERYYYLIQKLTDNEYEEDKEYYNELENIW